MIHLFFPGGRPVVLRVATAAWRRVSGHMIALAAGLGLAVAAGTAPAGAEPARTIIVMDGSGSMWGQIDGQPKLQTAREAVAEMAAALPPGDEIGVMAYGHRVKGDCGDIELLVPPAAGNAAAVTDAVNAMRFLGKTPLSEAVRLAAEGLRHTEQPASVVLVTDGIETCGGDPCALARELEASGVDFTAHVIGFGLSADEGAAVACIAGETGGRYIEARDAASLAGALKAVVTREADAAPPADAAAPDPAPAEVTHHFAGEAWMPQTQIQPSGRSFGPPQASPDAPDFPADATAEACQAACTADALCGSWQYEPPGSYFVEEARCRLYSPGTEFGLVMTNPDEVFVAGMKDGVKGLVRPYVPIGAVQAAVTLALPEPAAPGAEFVVQWSGPAGTDDWIDLVPAGTDDLSPAESHFFVNDTVEEGDRPEGAGVLIAPTAPGDYELRYVLGRSVDMRVIHRVALVAGDGGFVLAAAAAGDGPDGARPGALPATVPVRLAGAGAEGPGLAIAWSAVPLPGQGLPPEAWAMPEAVQGPVTADFLPGTYEVRGDAGDTVFAATLTITAEGPNDFVIPVSAALSPSGPDAGGAGPVDVVIRAEGFDGPVDWSAMPRGGGPDDRLADRAEGGWATRMDPGPWAVFGMAEDASYFADIVVTAAGGEILIPREMPVPVLSGQADDAAALAERLNGVPVDLGRLSPEDFERLLGLRD